MEKINKRKEYVTNPARIVSFGVFIFGLGVTYATLTNRISKLEEFQRGIDMVKIESTLSQIQTDISWIKANLNSK